MPYGFFTLLFIFFNMILNDLKVEVEGRFYKEIIVDDDEEDLVYIFPDTEKFISILRRKMNKEIISPKSM
ncbi:MAG TPA: hypothetical protein ENI29_02765 [bacterium]|nr:hypothetical protein [bacterium]